MAPCGSSTPGRPCAGSPPWPSSSRWRAPAWWRPPRPPSASCRRERPNSCWSTCSRREVDGLSGTVHPAGQPRHPRDPRGRRRGQLGAHLADLRHPHAAGPLLRRRTRPGWPCWARCGETDVIINGTDVWIWSSRDQAATHRTIDPGSRPEPQRASCRRTCRRLRRRRPSRCWPPSEPTTTVSTDSAVTVADRAAYELVLDPNDDATLISQVRIAIDGETKMPLRVQVFGVDRRAGPRGRLRPGQLHRPGRPGVRVQPAAGAPRSPRPSRSRRGRPTADERKSAEQKAEDARERVRSSGTGWSAVVVGEVGGDSARAAGRSSCRPSSASCRRSRATGAPVGCWPGPPSPWC